MWEMIQEDKTTNCQNPKAQILPANHKDLQALNITAKSFKFLVGIHKSLSEKFWTCSGKSELYSEKSGPFWNWNPPSLLHDMTAEKMEFVFGFETLMTPKWVYINHLKAIGGTQAPIGHEPGLTNGRYSYIKPCCFATALQQGTHSISIKVPLRSGGPFCFSRSS